MSSLIIQPLFNFVNFSFNTFYLVKQEIYIRLSILIFNPQIFSNMGKVLCHQRNIMFESIFKFLLTLLYTIKTVIYFISEFIYTIKSAIYFISEFIYTIKSAIYFISEFI